MLGVDGRLVACVVIGAFALAPLDTFTSVFANYDGAVLKVALMSVSIPFPFISNKTHIPQM